VRGTRTGEPMTAGIFVIPIPNIELTKVNHYNFQGIFVKINY
jgi:hypothetical protein